VSFLQELPRLLLGRGSRFAFFHRSNVISNEKHEMGGGLSKIDPKKSLSEGILFWIASTEKL
jgi:hypothetical protein